MRRPRILIIMAAAAVGLVLPSLAVPAGAHPMSAAVAASTEVTWCSTSTAPCITSASRDGSPVTAADPDWSVTGTADTNGGAYQILWGVASQTAGGTYTTMGPAEAGHTWSVSLDLGAHVPRVTDSYGDDITIARTDHGDGTYDLTVTGKVVTMAVNAECDTSVFPADCPTQAHQDVTTFAGEISDFGQWSDSSQIPDFYGMDSWTNVEVTYIPATISGDPLQFTEPLANSHKLATGEVFHGFYHVVLPNGFLEDMGIDDPSTLDPSGLTATVGSGAVSVSPGSSATQVDATGITFSPRKLKIARGRIVPTRPAKLHAKRVSGHRAKLAFHRASPRGSKIVRYQSRCTARHSIHRASGKHSPVIVKALTAGVHYDCQVRAKSKAGFGRWSKKDRV